MRFRALPFLANPHLQTLLGSGLGPWREPPSATRRVALPDGDQLALEVSRPRGWTPTAPTVVLVHGLCGSHRSSYMVRLAAKLVAAGVRAVRLNLRGNGSGAGLARRPYHAGSSHDVRVALEALRAETPGSPLWLVGFSLGGNIVLKLAGELGREGGELLRGVSAICPAVDLPACARRLEQPHNWLYERLFVGWLVDEIRRRHALTGEPLPPLPARPRAIELDDLYTAPRAGFAGADEYYRQTSALPLLRRIELPCRILVADDDPLVDSSWAERTRLSAPVRLLRTPLGGHMGFLRAPGRWFMDEAVLRWVGAAGRGRAAA